jgi:competence protein ComEA
VTPQADLSGLNLAAPVHDGIRINIPGRNVNDNHLENDQLSLYKSIPLSGETESHGSSNLVVQINTASLEELKKLPGIGDVIAQRIIEYRQTHGPFHSVEELLNVKGIGEKKLQDIKDSIIF